MRLVVFKCTCEGPQWCFGRVMPGTSHRPLQVDVTAGPQDLKWLHLTARSHPKPSMAALQILPLTLTPLSTASKYSCLHLSDEDTNTVEFRDSWSSLRHDLDPNPRDLCASWCITMLWVSQSVQVTQSGDRCKQDAPVTKRTASNALSY